MKTQTWRCDTCGKYMTFYDPLSPANKMELKIHRESHPENDKKTKKSG